MLSVFKYVSAELEPDLLALNVLSSSEIKKGIDLNLFFPYRPTYGEKKQCHNVRETIDRCNVQKQAA